MSRTHKDRQKRRRLVKSSYLKKLLHCYAEDFHNKMPIRTREKRIASKKIKESDIDV